MNASEQKAEQKAEYEAKKQFLEDLKGLEKSSYEEIFRIVKDSEVEYTENSNGIFFDVAKINMPVFEKLQSCILRNKTQKVLEKERLEEVKALMTPSN
jgi:hypothetical protein